MMNQKAIPASLDEVKSSIDSTLAAAHTALRELNHEIWSNPELAYEEHKAHDTICNFLERQGIAVTRHTYGLETSFEATSGSGGHLISFNAEYDALPGIGHACGHNLITTSSMAAFLALSELLKKFNIPGRARLLGTPAEENGGGKAKLIDAGAYKEVDIMLMAHPGPKTIFPGVQCDGVGGLLMNARKLIRCEFSGKSAHAGGNPWAGINALDALVASYNNVSMLRQQLRPDERIHCAFLDTPKVANVIASYTKAYWQVRAPNLEDLRDLIVRVRKCIEAGALATGCEVKLEEDELYADIRLNDTLCDRYQAHMGQFSRHVLKSHDKVLTGSTDAGNVSYVVPTLHTMFSIPGPEGSFPHHPSFASAASTDEAHEEAVIVGKSLALVGWDMLADESLFATAKRQWEDDVAGEVPT